MRARYLFDEILEFLLIRNLTDALLDRRILAVHDAAQRRVSTVEHFIGQITKRRELQDVLLKQLLLRDGVGESAQSLVFRHCFEEFLVARY